MDYSFLASELAYYSKKHLFRDEFDQVYLKNLLLGLLNNLSSNEELVKIDEKEIDQMDVPDVFVEQLKIISGNNLNFVNNIFGLLTPDPSQVISRFFELRKSSNPFSSLEYLYNLQIKNYYIQKTSISNNLKWKYLIDDRFIEITINLAKPEKNNKDVAKLLKSNIDEEYPKCALCLENLGFQGNEKKSSKANIRVIPLKLNNDEFFMQFSPYCYYPHHVIVINKNHVPMEISNKTFVRLVDFVDQFNEYFIGSNAELPIVGGSILNHEHYQGGKYKFPLMFAKDRFVVVSNDKLKLSYVDFFNSCIKVETTDRDLLINVFNQVLTNWRNYENKDIGIISKEDGVLHNTITPIIRKENNKYIGYIILRNNYCNKFHPDGVFHAHKEYHNIKKEGIGLIEAMGLFILPGRLKKECREIEEILKNPQIDLNKYYELNPNMKVHEQMIKILKEQTKGDYQNEIKEYINQVCVHILENTAVFKNDEKGNRYALDFIKSIKI